MDSVPAWVQSLLGSLGLGGAVIWWLLAREDKTDKRYVDSMQARLDDQKEARAIDKERIRADVMATAAATKLAEAIEAHTDQVIAMRQDVAQIRAEMNARYVSQILNPVRQLTLDSSQG